LSDRQGVSHPLVELKITPRYMLLLAFSCLYCG